MTTNTPSPEDTATANELLDMAAEHIHAVTKDDRIGDTHRLAAYVLSLVRFAAHVQTSLHHSIDADGYMLALADELDRYGVLVIDTAKMTRLAVRRPETTHQ
jgi:hypothetical protein